VNNYLIKEKKKEVIALVEINKDALTENHRNLYVKKIKQC
jgi:hypothetical protein